MKSSPDFGTGLSSPGDEVLTMASQEHGYQVRINITNRNVSAVSRSAHRLHHPRLLLATSLDHLVLDRVGREGQREIEG